MRTSSIGRKASGARSRRDLPGAKSFLHCRDRDDRSETPRPQGVTGSGGCYRESAENWKAKHLPLKSLRIHARPSSFASTRRLTTTPLSIRFNLKLIGKAISNIQS